MKYLLIAFAILVLAVHSHAGFINGSISVQGTATLDAPIQSAMAFDSFGPTAVTLDTGDYAAIPIGTDVTMHPFNFVDQVQKLWAIGGWSFETSTLVASRSDISSGTGGDTSLINVTGQGIARGPGFSPTFASYALHASGDAETLTMIFGNTVTSAGVADGGSTIIMMGAAVLCLSALVRFSRPANYNSGDSARASVLKLGCLSAALLFLSGCAGTGVQKLDSTQPLDGLPMISTRAIQDQVEGR